MKKLIIVGAGGFGREVLGYALEIQKTQNCWEVAGFIDDNLSSLDNYDKSYKIIGTVKDHSVREEEVFICAIGDPVSKLKVCRQLEDKGAEFINLIHPTSIIGNSCKIGKGLIMAPFSIITQNVNIGNFVTINIFSSFGHDSVAEDGCTLSAHCDVTGFAYLEEGVFLGSNAVIKPTVRIGKYSRIGIGSVVLKSVPDNVVVFGNPAKIVF
jgi:sugar O-acyltransferase (sialic acid O-acetyltransferase NeuD family)